MEVQICKNLYHAMEWVRFHCCNSTVPWRYTHSLRTYYVALANAAILQNIQCKCRFCAVIMRLLVAMLLIGSFLCLQHMAALLHALEAMLEICSLLLPAVSRMSHLKAQTVQPCQTTARPILIYSNEARDNTSPPKLSRKKVVTSASSMGNVIQKSI